ncbi:MerR family transcriptional regulator [Paenibacillus sp. NFR01]|uniref:MerR family transcriptional regulator n=1 Tax=Paenibacillus sp. NFR01 TaxID=1566279 RepID=UPI0008ADF552|nr:MerR family transcriptional regulator [Paenibacillus sp. NFR01]SET33699.1 DNA-binding transcriptional regulator, MerR family [Paenibacillus sp. NFR01]
MSYSVKEVAEKFNISPHTVRYYTDMELIPGVKRDANNRRLFDDASLGWLKTIIAFRTAGMSVELIKSYLELYEQGDATIPDRYGLLVEQRRLTAEKLEEMNKQMKVIDEKVDTYYDKMAQNKKQAGN